MNRAMVAAGVARSCRCDLRRYEYVEVGEDFAGFAGFLTCVEGRFPLAERWWGRVAYPAFATNWTTIWAAEGRASFGQIR
jgi:hypothetical protein